MDSSSFLPASAANGSAAGGGGSNGAGSAQAQHQAPPIREQDRLMPIANVIRIMRRVLPAHAKISDDAKETIQECVSEYISFITGEANERCQREQRKTITAEDVLWAMSRLGFDDYIEPLSVYLHRYREFEGEARGVGLAPGPARGGGGGGDHHLHHHSMAPPPMLKSRAPGGAMAPHHHDMQLHASMYGGAVPPPPGHGFVMPHQGGHQYHLPYPYEPAYGGEHAAAMAAYYGGASYAPGNGGSGDGSGSSGGSASHTPHGGSFEHQHPFASYK
ncbi:Nuclear transcription factor Y subunit B-6 [Dichanthelium oligosanthes]|uniref:Nuclear transcription factor Y subunit B-6 n=1 Tax=Dichanthelium oligosanthes TaxID=888268 RepID=A0A1E5WLW5_9POAL|nr:Nuclear transcription factor Y subunit B-6 [Dichanthelium oligosanthes]